MKRILMVTLVGMISCSSSKQGDVGPAGPAGASVSVASLPAGDSHCPDGGAALTSAGGVVYVCNGSAGAAGRNGATGATGAPGTPGAPGAPGVDATAPSGAVVSFAGTTAPAGWLICDGSLVSRATYPALFAAIGVTFGAGDGNTTFALPDLRGRTVLGVGQGAGLTARTLGDTFGAETHTLTINEMPSHNHGVTDPGHAHSSGTAGGFVVNGTTSGLASAGIAGGGGFQVTGWTAPDPTYISIQNSGGGAAHSILPPAVALNYLIRI